MFKFGEMISVHSSWLPSAAAIFNTATVTYEIHTPPGKQDVFVISYWNLNAPSFGGARRIQAILDLLGDRTTLCQPAPRHPTLDSWVFQPDLGRRKVGINWGMFNFLIPWTAIRLRRLVSRRRPALIVATSIWAYLPLRRMRHLPPVVLDAHDVIVNAIEERFGSAHPFTKLVCFWERHVVRRVDHVFACSELDREQFIARYDIPPERISTVPNGVDMAGWNTPFPSAGDPDPHIDPAIETALKNATVLFFMGKLDYQPNREALRFFEERLMPELERDGKSTFRLLVCGGPAPAVSPHPAMIFAGRVPDVAPYVRRADICLAPIFTGSGTRLKILEYMAAAKPVVSTPKGAEGINGISNENMVCVGAENFTRAIQTLAADPETARRMGVAGYQLVKEGYDWNRLQSGWERVFCRLGLKPR